MSATWEPPFIADPYDLVATDAANRGSQGVLAGWDATLWWWGLSVNQAVDDLLVTRGGPILA